MLREIALFISMLEGTLYDGTILHDLDFKIVIEVGFVENDLDLHKQVPIVRQDDELRAWKLLS